MTSTNTNKKKKKNRVCHSNNTNPSSPSSSSSSYKLSLLLFRTTIAILIILVVVIAFISLWNNYNNDNYNSINSLLLFGEQQVAVSSSSSLSLSSSFQLFLLPAYNYVQQLATRGGASSWKRNALKDQRFDIRKNNNNYNNNYNNERDIKQRGQKEEKENSKNENLENNDNHHNNDNSKDEILLQQLINDEKKKWKCSNNHNNNNNKKKKNMDSSALTSFVTKFNAKRQDNTTTTNNNILNVHIIPHTHDDVGWRKTVEQYYYPGCNVSLDNRGSVRDIITSIIESLLDNPYRTFTYVEQKYFTMWWNEISESMQNSVHQLIENQQLAFVNGGWCMHDEATTHYVGMIDQTTLGHEFLYNTFDYIPSIGWQLDPFGHSYTNAKLLTATSGMNALYFGRIDYQDLIIRKNTRQCEGIWDTTTTTTSSSTTKTKSKSSFINHNQDDDDDDSSSNSNTAIFWGLTGSYGGNYGPPPGYCFDTMCPDDEPMIGMNETENRLYERIINFLQFIQIQSNQTQGNHIMITMGSDFHYQNAYYDYSNIDRLINTIMYYQQWDILNATTINGLFYNKYNTINIFYSNPEYYTYQKYIETIQSRIQQRKRKNRNKQATNYIQQQFQQSQQQQQQQQQRQRQQPTEQSANAKDHNTKHLLYDNNINDENNNGVNWTIKNDDFFPYSDCEHCFWTGYFTSRTAFKRFERVASSFLLAARQIDSLSIFMNISNSTNNKNTIRYTNNKKRSERESHDSTKMTKKMNTSSNYYYDQQQKPLFVLEDALGIVQHHDAVSGTAKQHVADDYSKKLQTGIDAVVPYISDILSNIMLSNNETEEKLLHDLTYCQLLNETICSVSQEATSSNDTVVYVVVYNPIAQCRSSVVRLPVSTHVPYRVERIEENNNNSSNKYSKLLNPIIATPLHADDDMQYVLVFDTGSLPPVGAVAFRITKDTIDMTTNDDKSVGRKTYDFVSSSRKLHLNERNNIQVSSDVISVQFDSQTGMIVGMSSDGFDVDITQEWGYYPSYMSHDSVSSGAYIFRPGKPEQTIMPFHPVAGGATFVNTSVGIEVHVTFRERWMKQVTRVITGKPYVEVEYTIGPVCIKDGIGKEIITRLSTPIKSEGVVYTDSNAREFMKRKRNYRPTWDLQVFEPVAGNYYPVNAAIYVEDENAALAVLVDRSQGGASLADGSIELMVQRRTLADDSRGVDEAMNETVGGVTPYPPYGDATRVGDGVIIRGKHRIMVGKGKVGASLARSEMDGTFAEPLVFVGSGLLSNPLSFRNPSFSGLQNCLPPNIMLITLARIPNPQDTTFLLRLGHQYAINENNDLSVPVSLDLSKLFVGYEITSIVEKTLGGAEKWSDYVARRFDWTGSSSSEVRNDSGLNITIAPMEIRTFEVTVSLLII